jgi:DNA-directed RNA polymerase specialized sigma24 family protein
VAEGDSFLSQCVAEELQMPLVMRRLLAFARRRTHSEAGAEDLLADAVQRVIDPDDVPWVTGQGLFWHHMTNVIRQQWDRHLRKPMVQLEIIATDLAHDETARSREPDAEEELERLRTLALWRSIVARTVEEVGDKHPRVRQILDLTTQGIDEPAEQARALGCDVEEIYRALQILRYHAHRLLEARDQAEEQRMAQLQAAAT